MNNLTLGLPYAWKHSDLTLHCLLEGYILSLLDALKGGILERKETIVHCCLIWLFLILHPFSPLEHTLLLFPSFSFLCKLFIEMEDWSGGGLGGGLGFFVMTRCRQSLSLLSLFIIKLKYLFLVHYMCMTMNILSMDVVIFAYTWWFYIF